MVPKILFIFFAFFISASNEGPCAITTKATKYTHCRDKSPTDPRNNVCCYLKSKGKKISRCVEMRRVDIKGKDKFKAVKKSIESGTYDYWLMDNYTGFEEYKEDKLTFKIDSLRCSNAQYLKYFGIFTIILLLF